MPGKKQEGEALSNQVAWLFSYYGNAVTAASWLFEATLRAHRRKG